MFWGVSSSIVGWGAFNRFSVQPLVATGRFRDATLNLDMRALFHSLSFLSFVYGTVYCQLSAVVCLHHSAC